MEKNISVDDVKKELDISDFNNLTPQQSIGIASYLDKMDPDEAKNLLMQIPEFALTVRTALDELKVTIYNGFESNNTSMKYYYTLIEKVSDALEQCIIRNDITPEERQKISNDLLEIIKLMSKKDTENKKHIAKETSKEILGTIALAALAAVPVTVWIIKKIPKAVITSFLI